MLFRMIWASEAIILVNGMNGSANRKLTVFTEALQLPTHERAAYVERACGGDVELRRAVEALLQEHDRIGDFLEKSPNAPRTKRTQKPLAPKSPVIASAVTNYWRQIGEGGCGVVFMAEQTQPVHRKVALKIIKPGMDTKSVIARLRPSGKRLR